MFRTGSLHSPATAFLSSSLSHRGHRCLSTSALERSIPFLAAMAKHSVRAIRVECATSIRSQDRKNRWSLDGMTALVTGGTRGIGKAVVEELVGLGAKVHTCARNADELQACLSEWHERGYGISGSVCDVAIVEQRVDLMENVSSLLKKGRSTQYNFCRSRTNKEEW